MVIDALRQIMSIKQFIIKGFFLFVATAIVSGCRSLYVPNTVNVPMLSEKKEFNGTVAYGLNGLDVQAAYSPIQNWAVMGNFAHIRAESGAYEEKSYGYLGEVGVGYYIKNDDILRADVYGGVGYTSTKASSDFKTSRIFNRDYARIFVQPSIGVQLKHLEPSFALRMNYVFPLKALFYEPAITLRFGSEKFKIMSQFGFSMANKRIGYEGPYNPFMYSLGINFRFGRHLVSKPKE
jgi:hypothetical protein